MKHLPKGFKQRSIDQFHFGRLNPTRMSRGEMPTSTIPLKGRLEQQIGGMGASEMDGA